MKLVALLPFDCHRLDVDAILLARNLSKSGQDRVLCQQAVEVDSALGHGPKGARIHLHAKDVKAAGLENHLLQRVQIRLLAGFPLKEPSLQGVRTRHVKSVGVLEACDALDVKFSRGDDHVDVQFRPDPINGRVIRIRLDDLHLGALVRTDEKSVSQPSDGAQIGFLLEGAHDLQTPQGLDLGVCDRPDR